MSNILLISGCVTPNTDTIKIKDSTLRLKQYLETLKRALQETNFDIIIFCENSNCKYDFYSYIENLNLKDKIKE